MVCVSQSSSLNDSVFIDSLTELNSQENSYWKIMVIDDDESTHQMTNLVLKDFTYKGNPMRIINGYSGKDACELMELHPDTAVILLDVVMESNEAGLKAVEYIRNQLKNKFVRIIIRTGQPGHAPEKEVIEKYDINDYKEKHELTTPKLYTAMVVALRSYQDLKKIQKLAMSNDTLEHLVRERTMELAKANSLMKIETKQRSESEHRLAEAQRLAKIGNWEWDLDSDDMIWSDQIFKIFEKPFKNSNKNKYSHHHYLAFCHPDDKFGLEKIHAEIKSGEMECIDSEYRILTQNGSLKYVKEKREVSRNKEGRIRYILGTLQDITQRKEIERKLAAKQKIMIHQSRLASMGEMIGNIAHQWRQPLNALSLSIQKLEILYEKKMLDKASLNRSVLRCMNLIKEMSTTIDDFKSFFSPDKEMERFSVEESILKALEILAPSLEYYNIRVEVDINSGWMVNGYKNEFMQVVLNVLSNAKDAVISSQVEQPLIVVKTQHKELIVTDNGGGIDTSILPFIFDPYYTTKEEGKGTGIGLYMSKLILEEHMQGNIQLSNTTDGVRVVIQIND